MAAAKKTTTDTDAEATEVDGVAEAAVSEFNWADIVDGGTTRRVPVPAGVRGGDTFAAGNLPPFPQGMSYMIGRLPIKCDTKRAVVQLPEPIKNVHCAVVVVNSGVLADCYRPSPNVCVPNALSGRPLNDREILVVTDSDGDGKTVGAGWTPGTYQGSQPTTRSIETGVPYVEVVVYIGVGCGCDSDNWAADNEWGQ